MEASKTSYQKFKMKNYTWLIAAAAIVLGAVCVRADAPPIKIGMLLGFSSAPEWATASQRGSDLAVEKINAQGGVLGRKLEVLYRDSKEDTGEAIKQAEQLVLRDGVSILSGTVASGEALAINEFAAHNNLFFLATIPCNEELIWSQGKPTTFRLHPSSYSLACMLAEEAAKLPAKRWAVIGFYSNYCTSMNRYFRERLSQLRPDVEWVAEQWTPIFKLNPGSAINALRRAKPDAIFDLLLLSDQRDFIRHARTVGFLNEVKFVAVNAGLPEEMALLSDEAPEGWITGGYPLEQIPEAAHQDFVRRYRAKYGDYPRHSSLLGYLGIESLAAGIGKAGAVETSKLIAAFKGLQLDSVVGPLAYRAIDHQSTLGYWIGKLGRRDGKPALVDWSYKNGLRYMPSDEEVRKLRPGK